MGCGDEISASWNTRSWLRAWGFIPINIAHKKTYAFISRKPKYPQNVCSQIWIYPLPPKWPNMSSHSTQSEESPPKMTLPQARGEQQSYGQTMLCTSGLSWGTTGLYIYILSGPSLFFIVVIWSKLALF